MLRITNQYWSFKSEQELNAFLDACMADSNNEFNIERYGKSQKGVYYAYGSIIPTAKFSKEPEAKTDSVNAELNLG